MRHVFISKYTFTALAAAALTAGTTFAQCPADDALEDNDDCASAVVIPSGSTTGLVVHGAGNPTLLDDDFYIIQAVPTGVSLTVDALFTHALGDIDIAIYDDAACSVYLAGSASVSDNEQVSTNNQTGVAKDYYLKIHAFGSSFDCNTYDLNISTAPIAPTGCSAPDDNLEENDDCASATPMSDGLTNSLFVSKSDPDFYKVSVADGDTLYADALFSTATADVDLYLYEDISSCGDLLNYLDRGFSTSDDENVSGTNTSGSTQDWYVMVIVYANAAGDCNTYDLSITGAGGSFATPFCFGDGSGVPCPCLNESALGSGEGCQSSLGYGAILTANGSASVANDDLSFTISQGRPSEPSMLVQGSSLLGVPFKDGVLCMGNPTERVEVVFMDATGVGTSTSSIVTEGNIPGPGATRYYQQWYRDPGGVSPCGNGSNFTNGLTVVFD